MNQYKFKLPTFIRPLLLVGSLFLLCADPLFAQRDGRVFHPSQAIPVEEFGHDLNWAWAGGMNNPQLGLADLNQDGLNDLVIYESFMGVKTFINQGSPGNPQYRYEPSYEAHFPTIYGFMQLVDYNRDQIPDLFHRGNHGIGVYTGYYDNQVLKFRFFTELFYQGINGWTNVYTDASDIPAIVDVDGDGDLDIVTFYQLGKHINFYRNCQVEKGLPTDSIVICVMDACWGKVYQGYERTHQLGINCGNLPTTCKGCDPLPSGQKVTHAGNTLLLFDEDGDGDLDMLCGNIDFSDIQFLRNGKADFNHPRDTMIFQDTAWGPGTHSLYLPQWPASFYLDIDDDGDRDLLFTPHAYGSENRNTVVFYENKGTDAHPQFEPFFGRYLSREMIDLGTNSYPVFYDYDRDGLDDLFVGSEGIFEAAGILRSRIFYYRNVGTATDPAFQLVTDDFLGLRSINLQGAAMAFGDLDGDGKDDLIIGQANGRLVFLKNQAVDNASTPNWVVDQYILRDEDGEPVSAGKNATPALYDLNGDGHLDLILGNQSGRLTYYENTAAASLGLRFRTHDLGQLRVDQDLTGFYGYSVPYFGTIDNTGKPYLVIGAESGRLYRYEIPANWSDPFVRVDSFYSWIEDDLHAAPSFTDFDGDGLHDLVIGNHLGGLRLYKQLFSVNVEDHNRESSHTMDLYPNPAIDKVRVRWQGASQGLRLQIRDLQGRLHRQQEFTADQAEYELSLEGLAPGSYFIHGEVRGKRAVKKLLILPAQPR